jgi:hypothetical protein
MRRRSVAGRHEDTHDRDGALGVFAAGFDEHLQRQEWKRLLLLLRRTERLVLMVTLPRECGGRGRKRSGAGCDEKVASGWGFAHVRVPSEQVTPAQDF